MCWRLNPVSQTCSACAVHVDICHNSDCSDICHNSDLSSHIPPPSECPLTGLSCYPQKYSQVSTVYSWGFIGKCYSFMYYFNVMLRKRILFFAKDLQMSGSAHQELGYLCSHLCSTKQTGKKNNWKSTYLLKSIIELSSHEEPLPRTDERHWWMQRRSTLTEQKTRNENLTRTSTVLLLTKYPVSVFWSWLDVFNFNAVLILTGLITILCSLQSKVTIMIAQSSGASHVLPARLPDS